MIIRNIRNTSEVWIWHLKLNSYWHYWCQRWKLNSSLSLFVDALNMWLSQWNLDKMTHRPVNFTICTTNQIWDHVQVHNCTSKPPSSTLCPHLCCNKMLDSIDQQLLVTWEETKHTEYSSWSDMCNLTFILTVQLKKVSMLNSSFIKYYSSLVCNL